MFQINKNFLILPKNYLFSEIARRVEEFSKENPNAKIIKMGIGDVTLPLPKAVITAMHNAVDELSEKETFKGYGPEQGYSFLREAIAENDFRNRGVDINPSEIYVSDGAKTDTANFIDLFASTTSIAVTDPVYPVYVDSNVLAGRGGVLKDGRWDKITYLSCNASNNFSPDLPSSSPDLIYLCLPNNPTGTTLTRDELKKWVDFAQSNGSLILFDAAYEAFIREKDVPHSIYEIEGAKSCSVEFRSFSKTAGFTGVRCGYVVIPREISVLSEGHSRVKLGNLWLRRQTTKFNGASYITQRGAEAVYSEEGKKQVQDNINYYLQNADIIRETLLGAGYEVYGGVSSPYVWIKTPDHLTSWEFFDYLLKGKNIVGTPGSGFGPEGEGYFRLSSFNSRENTLEAMKRIIE